MASLKIKGLRIKYGDTVAVENLDLEVKNKEFVVLVGPSGCGKTTTLNCIAGLIEANAGEMWFGNEMVMSADQNFSKIPQRREVAMVFQDYAIYPHMTVFGNMAFPLQIRKINRYEIEKRVNEAADLLEIGDLLQRKPNALSGGQRQRIALGRAMVRNPKIFLLDEPLANLDAKLRVRARVQLKELQQRLGVTSIFVTHDQVEAMTVGDRIAVMNKGQLEQMGTPDELYHHPRNKFVAGFIGSPAMNMLDGKVTVKNGKFIFKYGASDLELKEINKKIVKENEILDVSLGVRPEKVILSKKKIKNSLEAKINHIELTGKEYNVHLRLGEIAVIAFRESVEDMNIGDRVWITFDMKNIHLFNLKSGFALI